jgi:hypothetical protein
MGQHMHSSVVIEKVVAEDSEGRRASGTSDLIEREIPEGGTAALIAFLTHRLPPPYRPSGAGSIALTRGASAASLLKAKTGAKRASPLTAQRLQGQSSA